MVFFLFHLFYEFNPAFLYAYLPFWFLKLLLKLKCLSSGRYLLFSYISYFSLFSHFLLFLIFLFLILSYFLISYFFLFSFFYIIFLFSYLYYYLFSYHIFLYFHFSSKKVWNWQRKTGKKCFNVAEIIEN